VEGHLWILILLPIIQGGNGQWKDDGQPGLDRVKMGEDDLAAAPFDRSSRISAVNSFWDPGLMDHAQPLETGRTKF
jgi:hypothetical protein